MTPSEIIANDPESKKAGPVKVLASIAKLTASGEAILLRSKNTVLLVIKIAPETAELHLYSVDSPVAIGMAMKDFHDKLVKSDVKRVYGSAPAGSPIVRLMRMMGFEMMESDNPKYSWMGNV